MSTKKTKFKVNQQIVYPSQGTGKIVEIKEKLFNGEKTMYYVIYLEVSDMTIMVPIDRCSELGIRSIVSAAEVHKALDVIGESFEPITSDWKLRYQLNMDLLKKGTVQDIAMIVRSLYHRSKVKELPILERKLYDSAKKLLEDEIASALKLTTKEVEQLLLEKLEPLGKDADPKKGFDAFEDGEDKFLDDKDDEILIEDDDDDVFDPND